MTKPADGRTQEFLQIADIRDGVVILKNGGLRKILMASSLNFELKSQDEQEALTYAYQNVLNSLDFSIQVVIHSRRLNIAPYLDSLRERMTEEENELLKIQTEEYLNFVKTFVESYGIMSKSFFVVVPFSPAESAKEGFLSRLGGAFGRAAGRSGDIPEERFREYQKQLEARVELIVGGLTGLGMRVIPLGTEELIELFYSLYNPSELEKQSFVLREE